MKVELTPADVARIYGKRLFAIPSKGPQEVVNATVLPEKVAAPVAKPIEKEPSLPAFTWKGKPTQRVVFIMNQEEFTDRELTELLKKIVRSIKLPLEEAGFGIVNRKPVEEDFADIPVRFAVVLDDSLNPSGINPLRLGDKFIVFGKRLSLLANDQGHKKALWDRLQEMMNEINPGNDAG